MKAICNLDVPVDSKALKPSLQTEEETKSSFAKDKSTSHPLPPTPMVGEMHKEAQQVAGGPTSLGATNEKRTHPQLSSDILKDTRSALFTHDSPPDKLIILSDESEEKEEVARDKDTEATSHDVPTDTSLPPLPSPKSSQIQELMVHVHLLQSQKEVLEQEKANAEAKVASMKAKPLYPDINQLTKLLITSLKPKQSKLLALHDFASCLPTELKELPLKITRLSRKIKELNMQDMEIELPGDSYKTRDIHFHYLYQVSSVQEKLKILDSLPSILHKVTDTLNRFATMMENESGATSMNVPSAGKATASPAEGRRTPKMLT
nr:hypothetical protein [Tanacetum cinerariifolium]